MLKRTLLLIVVMSLLIVVAKSQQQHLNQARGFNANQVYDMHDLDSINVFNGNLVLGIPLGGTFRTGGNLSYSLRLFYNSNLWSYSEVGPGTVGINYSYMTVWKVPVGVYNKGPYGSDTVWSIERFIPNDSDGTRPSSGDSSYTVASPNGNANAGMGFQMTLGNLFEPRWAVESFDPQTTDQTQWVYQAPDGSEHQFYPTLHEDDPKLPEDDDSATDPISYTRDGSYLRMKVVDANTRTIEFPDGTIHTLKNLAPPPLNGVRFSPYWTVTQMTDRFGNTVNIEYIITRDPSTLEVTAMRWVITDGLRTNYVQLERFANTPEYGPVIRYLDLEGFDGRRVIYNFEYDVLTIRRAWPNVTDHPFININVTVPFLKYVKQPDETRYSMEPVDQSYDLNGDNANTRYRGVLRKLTLPTGARVEWEYHPETADPWDPTDPNLLDYGYVYPTMSTGRNYLRRNYGGVRVRRLIDKDETGATRTSTWRYDPKLEPQPLNGNCTFFSVDEPCAHKVFKSRVTTPQGDYTLHYFSVYPFPHDPDAGRQPTAWHVAEYGLPLRKDVPTTMEDNSPVFLSSEVYNSAGIKVRENYVRYETDKLAQRDPWGAVIANDRRVVATKTRYLDDNEFGIKYTEEKYSEYDGLGHLRKRETDGNFASADYRQELTNYNNDRGVYFIDPINNAPGSIHNYTPFPESSPWVLNTYNFMLQREGKSSALQQFNFNPFGQLLRKRWLKNDGGENGTPGPFPTDVLIVYDYNADGTLKSEDYYGGDKSAGLGNDAITGNLPATSEYRINHTYEHKELKTSKYRNSNFFSYDVDIDKSTGLAKTSRDMSKFWTEYVYDAMGRVTSIKPVSGGKTIVEYQPLTNGVFGGTPKVSVLHKTNDGVTLLDQEDYEYDNLGRVKVEKKMMPGGGFIARQTLYNGMGWLTSQSEWQNWTEGMSNFSYKTVYSNYDAFGRAQLVTPPDGSGHAISFDYRGVREVKRTQNIANQLVNGVSTESAVSTFEGYDRQGRFGAVSEHSGKGINSLVKTTYLYDVGGRVKEAGTEAKGYEPPIPPSNRGAFQFTGNYVVQENAGVATIQVNRVGGSTGAVTVNFATSNGTAIADQDYTPASGTLTFASGETSKSFTVSITNDTLVEGNETINLTLSSPTGGATLGSPSTATLTIVDDDGSTGNAGALQFDGSIFAGAEGGGFAIVQVNRVGGSSGPVSVNYATSNGTAIAGQDYTATSGTLNFANGDTSKSFSIAITDDALVEGPESINFTLSSPTGGATLGNPSAAYMMVFDNDDSGGGNAGALQFDGGIFVGAEGGGIAIIQVNRVGGSTGTVAVNYATSNGTAIAGQDYTSTSGTLTFATGETTKTFTVAITDDSLDEPNESINVALTSPTGGAILGNPSAAYVTVFDNDDPTPTPTPTPTPASTPPLYRTNLNVALSANGGQAFASSTLNSNYPASALINGDVKGVGWGAGFGGWHDGTGSAFPDYLELHFNGEKRINEIDLFTLQDNFANPLVPTSDMTFAQYGVTSFRVNYWDSTAGQWATLTQVDGNTKVWSKLEFPTIKTQKLSIMILNGATNYSRVVEIEAWEAPASTNVALTANGGQAFASSTLNSSYPASAIINGDTRGVGWAAGTGGWHDGTGSAFPDYLELHFNGEKRINEIDFVTLQDNFANPIVPTSDMTFAQYGVTSFRINYWDSAAGQWATLTQVDGNNKVWRKLEFPAVKTQKLSIMILNGATNYSRVVEIEAWEAPVSTNVALTANGGQAFASSTLNSSYPASAIINGETKGVGWGAGAGGWHDGTGSAFPDYLELHFNGEKRINEIDLVTLQDNYATPIVPTSEMTFAQYGVTSFRVNYWDSASGQWITLTQVDGNNKVWRKLEFPAVKTQKLSIMILNGATNYSRVVEIEAWEAPLSTNVALASNGAQATASSNYNSLFSAAGAINGDRRTWGSGAGWNDATQNQYPDQWWVDFNGPKRINEIDIFTVQDNYNSPQTPTLDMTFSLYGLVDFDVYYLNSSGGFSTLAAIRGNDRVWRRITFEPVTTTKILVHVYNAKGYSRIVEAEAWEAPPVQALAMNTSKAPARSRPNETGKRSSSRQAHHAILRAATSSQQEVSIGVTLSQTRKFTYDNRGFLISEQLPEVGNSGNGTITYEYDSRGNVVSKRDGANKLKYTYDSAGRLTLVRECLTEFAQCDLANNSRPVKEFEYYDVDQSASGIYELGKLEWAMRHNYLLNPYTNPATPADVMITETYQYRGTGAAVSSRVLNTSTGTGFTQTFAHNGLGQMTSQTYPQCSTGFCVNVAPNRTISYTYDRGELTAVPGYAKNYAYHPNGLLSSVERLNPSNQVTVTETYEKDPNNMQRPRRITLSGAGINWTTGDYHYDGSGNIKKIGSDWYVYDGANRLVEGTALNTTIAAEKKKQIYTYDPFGNIVQREDFAYVGTPSEVSTALVQPQMLNELNRFFGIPYDASGNATGESSTPGIYQYDALNKMTVAPGKIYIYTADDERVWAVDHSAASSDGFVNTFTLRGRGNELLREYTQLGSNTSAAAWTWTKDYIHGGGRLLASESSGERLTYHADHLGSPRVITNTSGVPLSKHNYLPFGEEASNPNQDAEKLKFTGHERDSYNYPGHPLDYLHARHYLYGLGKFLSIDPARDYDLKRPQSLNLYAYVRNNPVNATDPTGRATYEKPGTILMNLLEFFSEKYDGVLDRIVPDPKVDELPPGACDLGARFEEAKRKKEEMKSALDLAIGHFGPEFASGIATAIKTERRVVAVIGRYEDVKPFIGKKGYAVLNISDWTWEKNLSWLLNHAADGGVIKVVTTPQAARASVAAGGNGKTFLREMQTLWENWYFPQF
jgi:RHS repeat-associated protein